MRLKFSLSVGLPLISDGAQNLFGLKCMTEWLDMMQYNQRSSNPSGITFQLIVENNSHLMESKHMAIIQAGN